MKTLITIFISTAIILLNHVNAQWTQVSTGLPASSTVRSMISIGNYVFAGLQYQGVYRSSNNGDTWVKAGIGNDSLSAQIVFALCKRNGILFAGARNGCYVSTDNGVTFTRKVNGFPGGGQTTIYSLTLSGNNIVAATTIWYSNSRIDAIFYSGDNGNTWQQANLPVNAVAVTAVTSDGSPSVYAGVYGQSFSTTGLYKSTNFGATWTAMTFSINADIDEIANSGNNVYASNSFASFYSTNAGNTWLNSSPPCGGIWTYTLLNNYVFAGNCAGMYYSTNHGNGWTGANAGFPGSIDIEASCNNQTYLFAGASNQGIWRIPLSYFGINGIITTINEIPEQFGLLQNYPNPFNPTTHIGFRIADFGFVTLKVFDVTGKETAILVNEELRPGTYEAEFDASNFPSGVYYYKLIAENYTETRKMVLVK